MPKDPQPRPAGEHIIAQYTQMRPLLSLLGLFSGDFRRKSEDLDKQFAEIERMKADRVEFAARFGPRGWTIYDRLSVDVVHGAVSELDNAKSEQSLVTYHLAHDTLKFLGHRFKTGRFRDWDEIYERAVERAHSTDFLSAVPLVLIITDGICTTKTGKHPFSGGADAPVFDSETSGPGGLSAGLAVFGATRRKLDTSPIDSPYRHGILHGLNPAFGNPLVAAKAFNLLQAMVDYFDHRDDEEARISKASRDQRQPSWSELAATLAATRDVRRRIEEWAARPAVTNEMIAQSGKPHDLAAGAPEAMTATYLDAILARNFGNIAKHTIDYPLRSIGYRAGRHRDELGEIGITSWQIIGVRDLAAAISEVDVVLEGTRGEQKWSGRQTMRLMFGDEKFDAMVRGTPGGSWAVMPNFLPQLWVTALKSKEEGSFD